MISKRLKQFLEDESVSYEVIEGLEKDYAKIIIVRAGLGNAMVVMPASCEIDLGKLGVLLDVPEVTVSSDTESAGLFPDCEAGAMPAIGRLYGLPCYIDETLLDGPSVCFKGGNHREGVRISSYEYWRIAQAEVGDFRLRKIAV